MTIQRTCKRCGHAILAAHAGRKYCSPECYRAVKKRAHERALELRYAPPRPLASRGEFEVGQTVRVPSTERREIGGKVVTVAVTEPGIVRAVMKDYIIVSVGNKTVRCTRAQLAACAPKELPVQFGYGIAVGGGAS